MTKLQRKMDSENFRSSNDYAQLVKPRRLARELERDANRVAYDVSPFGSTEMPRSGISSWVKRKIGLACSACHFPLPASGMLT